MRAIRKLESILYGMWNSTSEKTRKIHHSSTLSMANAAVGWSGQDSLNTMFVCDDHDREALCFDSGSVPWRLLQTTQGLWARRAPDESKSEVHVRSNSYSLYRVVAVLYMYITYIRRVSGKGRFILIRKYY